MIGRADLRRFLIDTFTQSDLRDLCFLSAINYDALPGRSTSDKSRELILYCEKHGCIEELIDNCQEMRPNIRINRKTTRSLTPEKFDDLLPYIDYRKIIETFNTVIRTSEAVLLWIQNSNLMGGDWCVSQINDSLDSRRGFKYYYDIGLPFGARRDELGLLFQLATYFKIEDIEDLVKYGQSLTNAVLESIKVSGRDDVFQGGSIIMIVFRYKDNLSHLPKEPFTGFINYFWIPMLNHLSDLAKSYQGIKLVAVFTFDGEFSLDEPTLYCTYDQFKPEKILDLQLQYWREDEIAEWLAIDIGMPMAESAQVAKRIYQDSQGAPLPTRDALRTQLFGDS